MTHYLDEVQHDRTRFLESRRTPTKVREIIADSWQRSMNGGISPTAEFSFESDIDLDSRMCRAAAPIIRRVADQLDGTGTSLFLANDKGVLLDRWVDTPDLARSLDRANSITGARISEGDVGTNGVGTAIVTESAISVTGPEHWSSGYQGLACSGAPIRNPISGRIEGALAVTSHHGDYHPVVLSLVRRTAEEIEASLLLTATIRERAILDTFLTATRRSDRAIMTVSPDMLISTPAASRIADRIDRALLWQYVNEAASSGRTSWFVFPLDGSGRSGSEVEAKVVPAPGQVDGGVVVEFRERRSIPRSRSVPRGAAALSLVGSSELWAATVHGVDVAVRARRSFVLHGEAGVGKYSLVRELADRAGMRSAVVDSALEPVDGAATWLSSVREARAGACDVVILRRLQLASEAARRALAATIDADDSPVPVIALTVESPSDAEGIRLVLDAIGGGSIVVPALRSRSADIADLIDHFSGTRTWSMAARRALMRHDWSENVRELKRTVQSTIAGFPTGELDAEQLPPDVLRQSAGRRLSRFEEVEMSVLLSALREARGNKSAAAEILGVSRSTVYRKLASAGRTGARETY